MNYQGYVHHIPTLVTACGLTLLLTLESWLPTAGNRRRRLRHTARNLTLWFLNALALALLAAPLIANVAEWAEERQFGLLNLLSLPVHSENSILAMKSPFSDDAAPTSSSN